MHIGLENLQHFPAFGSPPHNSSPQIQPDFTLAPPSPLSSSPSGESTCFYLRSALLIPFNSCLSIHVIVSDVMTFPSLNGESSSPIVGSVEDDSYCMSFAQVCLENHNLQSPLPLCWEHSILDWKVDFSPSTNTTDHAMLQSLLSSHGVIFTVSCIDAERWESQSGCWAPELPKERYFYIILLVWSSFIDGFFFHAQSFIGYWKYRTGNISGSPLNCSYTLYGQYVWMEMIWTKICPSCGVNFGDSRFVLI